MTQTPIIKQIFNLVTSKLNLELTVLDVNIVSGQFDIIIIEDILWDDKFPLKSYANKLGVISKNQNYFKSKVDFLLSKPFLPSDLLDTITKQIDAITSKRPTEVLVENISDEDESVVQNDFVNDGGILDSSELLKIQDLLLDDKMNDDADDWIELSKIIDQAMDEIDDCQFDVNAPVKLVLNEYSISDMSGLLNKLDQDVVDALMAGEEITLKLKVNK
jgi:hypothetical protein